MSIIWKSWFRKRDGGNRLVETDSAHAFEPGAPTSACGLPVGVHERIEPLGLKHCTRCQLKLGLAISEATRDRRGRAKAIERLLASGHSLPQVAAKLAVTTEAVLSIIADFGLSRPNIIKSKSAFSHNDAIERTVSELDAASASVEMLKLNPAASDGAALTQWCESMDSSLRIFRRLRNRIDAELKRRANNGSPIAPAADPVVSEESHEQT